MLVPLRWRPAMILMSAAARVAPRKGANDVDGVQHAGEEAEEREKDVDH